MKCLWHLNGAVVANNAIMPYLVTTLSKEQVGLTTIQNPTEAVEKAMWRLYLEYEKEMQMDTPFDVATEFIAEHPALQPNEIAKTTKKTAKMVFIESAAGTDYARMEYELVGQKLPNHATQVTLVALARGWTKEL